MMRRPFPKYVIIYCIKIGKKRYIGSSLYFEVRKGSHLHGFKNKTHHNKHLQNAANKYGLHKVEFLILEKCSRRNRRKREQYWIDRYKTTDSKKGYNVHRPVLGITPNRRLAKALKLSWTPKRKKEFAKLRKMVSETTAGKKALNYASSVRWSKPGAREKRSIESKRLWADPKNRKRYLERWNNKELKEKSLSGIRKLQSDPDYWGLHSLKMLKHYDDPANREKVSKRMRATWADPKHKAILVASRNTPEYKKRQSLALKRSWKRRRSIGVAP